MATDFNQNSSIIPESPLDVNRKKSKSKEINSISTSFYKDLSLATKSKSKVMDNYDDGINKLHTLTGEQPSIQKQTSAPLREKMGRFIIPLNVSPDLYPTPEGAYQRFLGFSRTNFWQKKKT